MHQHNALQFHCRLAVETLHPRFAWEGDTFSVILSVNSGYE
jgi:hypothetical protein